MIVAVSSSKRPLLLPGPFTPSHADNRMQNEGDVAGARKQFLASRFANLDVLLEQRYGWMNAYIEPNDTVIEFGCGAGFSRLYLHNGQITLTDYFENNWVDRRADAMAPDFESNSIDVIICSHVIHHMAKPVTFFKLVYSLLKTGGRIIIQDLNTALLMRLLLRMMRHEGWSYEVDVFDETVVSNDPRDPWSANCAIPELLFESTERFEKAISGYRVLKNSLNECLLFPLSGGVTAKTPVPKLPRFVLRVVRQFDRFLVWSMPSAFALGRSVVLEKIALPKTA